MTSIPAAPGSPAPQPFRLTLSDLQRITEQAIVDLAAAPFLLCEEAAAKAMFARAAMDLKLDVLNQDTNKKLIAMRTASNPGGGYGLVNLGRTCGGKVGQRNKDLLMSKYGFVGEADVQFKVHPGYGVKDLSTETHVGSLVLDLISLYGGQDRCSLKGPSTTRKPLDRVQAVVLVLANTNGQLKWLDGSRGVEGGDVLPRLIPSGIIKWAKDRKCDVKAGECEWSRWNSEEFDTQWVCAPVPPPDQKKKKDKEKEKKKGRLVRLALGKNKEPKPLKMKCAAFAATSSLDARVISPDGQGTHDIYAFVWMRHDAPEEMS